jgi:hypothetical protein
MGSLRTLEKGKNRDKSETPPPPPEPGRTYQIGSREAPLIENHVYAVLCKKLKEMLGKEKVMELFRLKKLLVDDGRIAGYEQGGRGEFFGLPHAFDDGKFDYVEGYIYIAIPKDGTAVSRAEIVKKVSDYGISVPGDEIDAAIQNLMDIGIIRPEQDDFVFAH